MPTDLLYTAIGMKNYHPLSSSDRAGVLSLTMQPPESAIRCPECKSTDVIRRGTVDRKVYAPPIGLRTTLISIKTPRVECRTCNCVKNIELPKVVPLKNHTKSFARLAVDLRKMMTVADVSVYLGVSESMIRGIDKTYLNRKFAKPKLGHLKYLAIDEISVRKGHKYLTIVMDLVSGAVVFVGDGKGEESLKPLWKRLHGSRAKIQAVATDMSSAYYKAVQKNLPSVSHVFDRFHIVKLMNDKLTALRRELHRQAEDGPEKLALKGTRWLLLKNPQSLDADRNEHQRLEDALQLNRSLAIAYYLKEDLRQIWEQSGKREAGKFLTDWCARAKASGIRVLKTMSKTLETHRKGILAWYDHRISTGPLEGLNNKIKTLKRQAYGFRDLIYFKLKIYAIHLAKFELIG
jgi:transposase